MSLDHLAVSLAFLYALDRANAARSTLPSLCRDLGIKAPSL